MISNDYYFFTVVSRGNEEDRKESGLMMGQLPSKWSLSGQLPSASYCPENGYCKGGLWTIAFGARDNCLF